MTEVEVPTHHKALVYDKPGEISTKIETIETPKPGVGEVLIKLTHSGVCHSDQAVMTNRWPWLPYPTQAGQVGGHEGVGSIVALGPGAETTGVKVGDRVGIKWMAAVCGNCTACLMGRDACCLNGKISGYYTPGTFQQYAIGPAHYVTPIPDGLASDLAAPLLCGGVTVYAALKKSGAQPVSLANPGKTVNSFWTEAAYGTRDGLSANVNLHPNGLAGDTVVIPGAGGGLGHLAIQIGGKGMGFRMIGIDSGEKEQFVRSLGAEEFFDIGKYSKDDEGTAKLIADVKKASADGLGASAVVVCTAANVAYAQGLKFLRFGGCLVCVGVPEGAPQPIAGADPASMLAQELRIVGSAVGNRKDAIDTMQLAARGIVKTHFTVEPMSKLTDVFNRMDAMKLQGRVVIDLTQEN